MQLRSFLERTLPVTGTYAIFTSGDKRHYWFNSIDAAASQIEELGDRTDIYFAVATFLAEGTEFRGRTQDNVDQVKSFRLDLDAGEKKLATQGPEKVYENQQAALAGLIAFTKQTGLMPSLIVSSGEGLHVYYELDEPTIPEQWHPVARSFQKFGSSHGLKIDSAVTADYARVLRPVGTLHPNGKEVSVLKDTGKVYTLQEFADAVQHAAKPKYDLSINDDVLEVKGPPKTFRKIILKCAAMAQAYNEQESIEEPYWRLALGVTKFTIEGVAAAHAISSRHPSYDHDEVESKFERWQKGPPLCESFAEFCTKCASCKFKGKIKTPVQLGEMNVEEVESLPQSEEPEPPEAREVIEPIEAPAAKEKGNLWDDKLPKNFDVKMIGSELTLVCKLRSTRVNEAGEEVPIEIDVPFTHNIFWFGRWSDAYDTDDVAQVWIHKLAKDSGGRTVVRRFEMEQTCLASRHDLQKYLASKGIHLTTDKRAAQAMEAYTKAGLLMIANVLQSPKVTERFGLRILEGGSMVAAQGKYLIHGDGRIEVAMLGKNLRTQQDAYSVPLPNNEDGIWDASVWKTHIMPAAHQHVAFLKKFYGDKAYTKYQLAIMMSMASPFMAFVTDGYTSGTALPPNGLVLSLFSENGGKGKTTAMRSAQLAFGLPKSLNSDGGDLNSTALARVARFSMAGTLPVNLDEMGDMESKPLAELIRTIANGTDRVRLDKSGALKVGSNWALTCTIGTNQSQREIIVHFRKTSSAEQFRLIELNVEDVVFTRDANNEFRTEWTRVQKCAGALGALIHLLICKMGMEAVNSFVHDRVHEAADLVQDVKEESASRFQYRGLGAVLALHDMLAMAGIEVFDRKDMIEVFTEAYRNTVDFVEENVVVSDDLQLLSQALSDLHSKTIITQNLTDMARSKNVTQVFDRDVRDRVPNDAVARHIISTGETYMSSAALSDWCDSKGYRERALVNAAKHSKLLKRIYASNAKDEDGKSNKRWSARFNLHRGMREYTGGAGVSCYLIDVHRLGYLLNDQDLIAKFVKADGKVVDFPSKQEPEDATSTEKSGT